METWVQVPDTVLAEVAAGRHAAAAEWLAGHAHAGLLDKRGNDYFRAHLRPVAAILRPFGDLVEAAGWLHDIVEDTDCTLDNLTATGFHPLIVAAVDSVTRRRSETYDDLIDRAVRHPIGRLVKMADNHVNRSTLYLIEDGVTRERLANKYDRARKILEAAIAEPSEE